MNFYNRETFIRFYIDNIGNQILPTNCTTIDEIAGAGVLNGYLGFWGTDSELKTYVHIPIGQGQKFILHIGWNEEATHIPLVNFEFELDK